MKTIYKYNLKEQILNLPAEAQILSIQYQNDNLELWALVDTDRKLERRSFIIVGTGEQISQISKLNYITTVQQNDGQFIWHIFEYLG